MISAIRDSSPKCETMGKDLVRFSEFLGNVKVYTYMVKIGIIMGSISDLNIMKQAETVLKEFGIDSEINVVSAHRTPERMVEYGKTAHERGLQVIIAGAGGAAHLPGMIAAMSPLPVIGVPIKSSNSIDGWDSILSILQMPSGVPVATVALNGAKNAGILAAQMIGSSKPQILEKVIKYKNNLKKNVFEMSKSTDSKRCCLCMERLANAIVLPCGHGNFCFQCVEQVGRRSDGRCPTCRVRLTGDPCVMRVYM